MVLWRPIRPSRTNTRKRCHEISGVAGKFGFGVQNEAGQRLTDFCQENALVIANTLFQQHKRQLYTWTSPDGQCWNQIDCILRSRRWRNSIQSAKTRPRSDCGSDHELIAKFRLIGASGKTTRPFRYDLNQFPYDYTVEVTDRFNLMDRMPEKLWMEVHNTVQEMVIKTIPKKKMQKGKMVVWGGLPDRWEKKRSKRKWERYIHLNSEFQRIARRDKKVFLSD